MNIKTQLSIETQIISKESLKAIASIIRDVSTTTKSDLSIKDQISFESKNLCGLDLC